MKKQKRFLMLLAVVLTAVLVNAGAVFAARGSSNSSSYNSQIKAMMEIDKRDGWKLSSIAEDYTMYASYAAVYCGKANVAGIDVMVGMGKSESLPQHTALARGYYAYSFKKLFCAREHAIVYHCSHIWDPLPLYSISKWADFRAQAHIVEQVNKNGAIVYRRLTDKAAEWK